MTLKPGDLTTMRVVLESIQMELRQLLTPRERDYLEKTIEYISEKEDEEYGD